MYSFTLKSFFGVQAESIGIKLLLRGMIILFALLSFYFNHSLSSVITPKNIVNAFLDQNVLKCSGKYKGKFQLPALPRGNLFTFLTNGNRSFSLT